MVRPQHFVVAAFAFIGLASAQQLPANAAHGYLDTRALPNSLSLLPPPPALRSGGFARDEAIAASVAALRGTSRWARAASDADLKFPHAAATFACASGITISQTTTPHLYALLERIMIDVGLSTYAAKNHYQRTRPFVELNTTTCEPSDEAMLRHDGSYPSGHSAVGWAWALILTEIAPDHTDAILARGRDFGESRIICNAHWQSDVDAGRVIAAATVARLHADPAFLTDLIAAREEIAMARTHGAHPSKNTCDAEAASLRREP
ncbi:MAG: phosphatase PAP2 family protein [Pseudomonadota bacterium]